MDLTKFGDFSTLFHPYGVDAILYYEEGEENPWVVSIVLTEYNEHWTRQEPTYEAAMEALHDAYGLFLAADDDLEVVA